jgi:hypothetical protein
MASTFQSITGFKTSAGALVQQGRLNENNTCESARFFHCLMLLKKSTTILKKNVELRLLLVSGLVSLLGIKALG